jgi:predicted dehydrogenase
VLADLSTVVKKRQRPTRSVEAFTRSAGATEEVDIKSEDLASILIHFEGGAKASASIGQVCAGHKNGFWVEFSGAKASLRWHQEHQNELWIGHRHEPNATLAKDPPLLDPDVRKYTHLPGGHQEGWSDAFCNVLRDVYELIVANRGMSGAIPPAVATFDDGYRANCVVDALLESHRQGGKWNAVSY